MDYTKFYNRHEELALLREKYAQTERSGVMLALYGRRRVGKTELIKAFLKDIDDKLYFYVGLGERKIIFDAMSEAIREQTGEIVKIDKARDFFRYLTDKSRNNKFVLVLDEVQRFMEVAPDMITSLQNHWDETLKTQRIMIILVGSSIGMMQKIMDSRAGALYGRTQKTKISPFKYSSFRLMFSELSEEEKIMRYAVFGGTPYYLEKTKRYEDTLESIRELILRKDSELSEEPKNLLEYENVKVHAKYNSILQAISMGKETLKEIQDFTKMPLSSLPPYIDRLNRLLDLVRKNDPLLGKERLGRYCINDNFFRFWYRFVFPNETALSLGNIDSVQRAIKQDINSYIGRVFEEVVRELLIMHNLKEINGYRLNFENIGSWWDRNGNEIDILAYNLQEKTFLLGEVKCTTKPMDVNIVENLYKKSKLIQHGGKYRFIFVSKSGFTDDCIKKMKELNAVYLDIGDISRLFGKA